MSKNQHVVIVGGGVIGLSIAWELAGRGKKVTIIDRNEFGKKASWAGAGILTPSNSLTATQPVDRLIALGNDLHAPWSEKLLAQTGIDNGYQRCGGLYIGRTVGEKAALSGQKLHWEQYGIEFEEIGSPSDLPELHCFSLAPDTMVVRVPGEHQIRNTHHLQALVRACELLGVSLIANFRKIVVNSDTTQVCSIVVDDQEIRFDQICFAAGAWSQELLAELNVRIPLIPVRGQILLFKLVAQQFRSIINEGSRYIVPRTDGHVLVGSTTEEVGFDDSTTAEKLTQLQVFAEGIVPDLCEKNRSGAWAGLRPATHDGFPYMGRLANLDNVYIATGHFKAGLQMSTATAVIMADMLDGVETMMDVSPFDPSRLDRFDEFVVPDQATYGN